MHIYHVGGTGCKDLLVGFLFSFLIIKSHKNATENGTGRKIDVEVRL